MSLCVLVWLIGLALLVNSVTLSNNVKLQAQTAGTFSYKVADNAQIPGTLLFTIGNSTANFSAYLNPCIALSNVSSLIYYTNVASATLEVEEINQHEIKTISGWGG